MLVHRTVCLALACFLFVVVFSGCGGGNSSSKPDVNMPAEEYDAMIDAEESKR